MSTCPICKEIIIWDSHKCNPRWTVWVTIDDIVDELDPENLEFVADFEVYARDAEAAAEKATEKFDDEYDVAGDGSEAQVRVRPWEDTGPENDELFYVHGQMYPSYIARRKNDV